MNIATGREFEFKNPQDDPHLYPKPPAGFYYRYDGTLAAIPILVQITPSPKDQPSETDDVISIATRDFWDFLANNK
jgi:hypothetical protein